MAGFRQEGVSHSQLARCFSIDRATSYRWETAKPDWTLATLQEALLQAFEQSEETYASRRLLLTLTRPYIATDEGWLYLAVVIDWFSRLVVGWAVSDTPDSALCIQALQLAIHRRKPTQSIVFHTDRGSQYSSQAFRQYLQEAKMRAKAEQGNVRIMRSRSDFSAV